MRSLELPYSEYKPVNRDCIYYITINDDNICDVDANSVVHLMECKEYALLQLRCYNRFYSVSEAVIETEFGFVNGEYVSMYDAFKKLKNEAGEYFSKDSDSEKL